MVANIDRFENEYNVKLSYDELYNLYTSRMFDFRDFISSLDSDSTLDALNTAKSMLTDLQELKGMLEE